MEVAQSTLDNRQVSIRAHKYDGTEHRRWAAQLTSVQDSMIVVTGSFETEVNHPFLGRIERGTVSVEHYWTDRWYSVFRFTEPGGELRNYYCNVNAPTNFDGQVLTFVDLDIDILVTPELTYSILDEEEFAENVLRLKYPLEVQRSVRAAIDELVYMIENREFPFAS